jgi:YggT family protein
LGETTVLYSIFTLIVDTVASVLAGVLLLRFWMQVVRVRPPSSLAQFTFQLTDWLVRPLRRVLPGIGGYDWASLVGAFLIAVLSMAIDVWLVSQLPIQMILLLSVLRLLQWMFYGLMGLILIEVVFSWVNPHAPLAPFVRALNDPLMRPLRRIIPLIGNVDLSPLVALILLRIGLQLVSVIPQGIRLAVQIMPNAKKSEVVGVLDDALKIRLQAQPIEGKANEALIRYVAARLNLLKSAVQITHGFTNKRKILEVSSRDLTVEQAMQTLLPATHTDGKVAYTNPPP